MAKDTMETIKLAEESAKKAVLDAKEESEKILQNAFKKKQDTLNAFEDEKIKIKKSENLNASKQSEKIIAQIDEDTAKEKAKLQALFEQNKDAAIDKIISAVVS